MTDWADEEHAGAILAGEADPDEPTYPEPDGPDGSHDPDGPDPAAEPPLYYGSVDEFLREYLRGVYRRTINGRSRIWAARWWEYPEAVIRLASIHRLGGLVRLG